MEKRTVGRPRIWDKYKKSKQGDYYTFHCKTCGEEKKILISQLRFRKHPQFCSRDCYTNSNKLKEHGKLIGKEFGKKALEIYRKAREGVKEGKSIILKKTTKLVDMLDFLRMKSLMGTKYSPEDIVYKIMESRTKALLLLMISLPKEKILPGII